MKRQHARPALCALLLLACGSVPLGGCPGLRPFVMHEGTLTDRDLAMAWTKPRHRDAGNFSEQLKINVALDDGGTLYTKLTVTNLAKYDGRAELVANVERPDGSSYRLKVRKDRDEWQFGSDRFDVTVGDCTVVVGVGRVDVHLVGEDFALDYAVESDLPALRPPGGVVSFGGAFYTTTLPVPRGRMTGTLTSRRPPTKPTGDTDDTDDTDEVDASDATDASGATEAAGEGEASGAAEAAGEDEAAGEAEVETFDLEGAAYVEHRATDLAPYRMAKRWFKMSDVTPERTIVVSAFERTAELGGGIQGWVLVADEDGVAVYDGDVAIAPRAVATDAKTSYEVPALLFFESKEGPALRGVVRTNAMTSRRDDLAGLSRLERVVVRRLMKPWTFLFDDAEYLFKVRAAGDDGEYGDEVPWRGRGRFEVQQLNPD